LLLHLILVLLLQVVLIQQHHQHHLQQQHQDQMQQQVILQNPQQHLPVQVVRPQQPLLIPVHSVASPQERRRSKRSQVSRSSFSSETPSSSPSSNDETTMMQAVVKQEYPGSLITTDTPSTPSTSRRKPRNPIPADRKDDKYWKRRVKNNLAAKRSREAKREKENQLSMRAQFLEREHRNLAMEMERCRSQNQELRERLSKYEKIDHLPAV